MDTGLACDVQFSGFISTTNGALLYGCKICDMTLSCFYCIPHSNHVFIASLSICEIKDDGPKIKTTQTSQCPKKEKGDIKLILPYLFLTALLITSLIYYFNKFSTVFTANIQYTNNDPQCICHPIK